MYKFDKNHQFHFTDFNQPMGLKMNPENRWIRLRDICIQLGKIVQKYNEKKYYVIQIKALYDIVKCVDSDIDEKEKTEYVLNRYKILYPSHGGLSEFYIQDEDFATRLKLNEPVDMLKDDLWKIIKPYI